MRARWLAIDTVREGGGTRTPPPAYLTTTFVPTFTRL
jgi:hypothetical protein